jgi:hypothetical protein
MAEPVVRCWVWDSTTGMGVLIVDNRRKKQTKPEKAATKRRGDNAQTITYEQWLRRQGRGR